MGLLKCDVENPVFLAVRDTYFKRSEMGFSGGRGLSDSLELEFCGGFARFFTLVFAAETESAGRTFKRLFEVEAVGTGFSRAGRWLVSGDLETPTEGASVAGARTRSLNGGLNFHIEQQIQRQYYRSQPSGSQECAFLIATWVVSHLD